LIFTPELTIGDILLIIFIAVTMCLGFIQLNRLRNSNDINSQQVKIYARPIVMFESPPYIRFIGRQKVEEGEEEVEQWSEFEFFKNNIKQFESFAAEVSINVPLTNKGKEVAKDLRIFAKIKHTEKACENEKGILGDKFFNDAQFKKSSQKYEFPPSFSKRIRIEFKDIPMRSDVFYYVCIRCEYNYLGDSSAHFTYQYKITPEGVNTLTELEGDHNL